MFKPIISFTMHFVLKLDDMITRLAIGPGTRPALAPLCHIFGITNNIYFFLSIYSCARISLSTSIESSSL